MNDAEKFAKQNGIEWVKWSKECGGEYCYLNGKQCTFQHPEEVLAVCMKWDDYKEFLIDGLQKSRWLEIDEFVETYITTPGKLLSAAVEWGEGREK